MKLGTRGRMRSGYIRQNPTASTNLRASSTVWTALPSIRQFAARCCSSSCSVMLGMEVLVICSLPASVAPRATLLQSQLHSLLHDTPREMAISSKAILLFRLLFRVAHDWEMY